MLEQAIGLLPVEFREPFILREFDGFSYGEIAKMTGATLGMTKIRIYRAKQKMRELLKPYLGDSFADNNESKNDTRLERPGIRGVGA